MIRRAGAQSSEPVQAASSRFVATGNPFGCAESTLLALQEHFGLDDPGDGAVAMALNGGVAYSGGTRGAITGAAVALGRLAAARIPIAAGPSGSPGPPLAEPEPRSDAIGAVAEPAAEHNEPEGGPTRR